MIETLLVAILGAIGGAVVQKLAQSKQITDLQSEVEELKIHVAELNVTLNNLTWYIRNVVDQNMKE